MTPVEKQSLELILTDEFNQTIDRVFEEIANEERAEINLPWVGENTAYWMAKAAVAVLVAMDDAQEYMRRDGMLKE